MVMMARRLISILLIAIYAIVFTHDFRPHHHHTEACSSKDNHHHTSSNSDDCQFPFHQHDINEAGTFINTESFKLNFDNLNLIPSDLFGDIDFVFFGNEQLDVKFIPPIYKGPDFSSISFRGPPLA